MLSHTYILGELKQTCKEQMYLNFAVCFRLKNNE